MDEEVRLVLRGFANLNDQQKREVARIVRGYTTDGVLNEEVKKSIRIGMGPIGTGCPCCGR
jgi:hypothetical protein